MTGTFKTRALLVGEKPVCQSEVVFPVARWQVSVWKQHGSCCGAPPAPSAVASSPTVHSLAMEQVSSVGDVAVRPGCAATPIAMFLGSRR